ncbi:MAG: TlpA disulfide reductase family protein [Hyphomonadaceae bacterium]
MISRRTALITAGAFGLVQPAFAKADDLTLPPPLTSLRDLPLTRTDGAATPLGDSLAPSRAAVISLWATWCAPCSLEASHLSELRGKITADRLDIVGINIDGKREEAKIATFLKRSKVNFTQLRGDPKPTYLAFNGQMPITLPRLYVFTPSGAPTKVFGRYDGSATLKAIDSAIEEAIRS